MGISFRYKPPEAPTKVEEPGNDDFNADLEYLSSREELGLDTSDIEVTPHEPAPALESLPNSTTGTPNPSPNAPHPSEVESQARLESKSPFLKLADFIKSELRKQTPSSPEEQKTQKVISLYEKRASLGSKKQKGLQLKKVA